MADQFGVKFAVEGLSTVKAGFAEVESSARKAGATVASVGQQAADTTGKVGAGFASARQVVGSFSTTLSGAAAIASVFAARNEELKRHLEVVSLALSGASTAARTASAAFTAITGVIGIKIAAIAALAGAVVFLVRNWDQALAVGRGLWANFVAFLGRLWEGLATTGRGIGEILAGVFTFDWERITRGADQFRTGLGQIGAVAADVGRQVVGLVSAGWERLIGFFGSAKAPVKELTQTWREFTDAIIESAAVAEARRRFAAGASLDEAAAAAALVRQRLGEKFTNEELMRTLDALQKARQKDAQAAIDWAQIERDQVNPAAKAALELFEKFRHPAEEGMGAAAGTITENLEEIADAARQAQRVLGVEWPEALTLARQALRLAKEEGIGLADALQRLKFNRDFLRELEQVDSLTKRWFDTWEKFKFGAEDLAINEPPRVARGWSDALESVRQLLPSLQAAFAELFTDVLSNAKSFGEAILGFFRSVVNSIISLFAQRVAKKVFEFLLPVFGLASGGVVAGGLTPILAAQAGGVVSRPTLAMIGEGRQAEAVVPLPDNRSIPVRFTGERADSRPVEVTITNYVVFDRSQIPTPTPEEIQAVVVADIRKGGPIGQTIRRTVR